MDSLLIVFCSGAGDKRRNVSILQLLEWELEVHLCAVLVVTPTVSPIIIKICLVRLIMACLVVHCLSSQPRTVPPPRHPRQLVPMARVSKVNEAATSFTLLLLLGFFVWKSKHE